MLLDSTLIFISPYRMTPAELKELNIRLQDLVDKDFIYDHKTFLLYYYLKYEILILGRERRVA